MPQLIEVGIPIKPLLDSQVFNYEFDFDEWPTTHYNSEDCILAFNENMFQIRKHYRTVFSSDDFRPAEELSVDQKEKKKIFKIRYSLNMLPTLCTHIHREFDPHLKTHESQLINSDVNFMSLCAESDELEIFECETLQDLIQFKWDGYAWGFHFFGCMVHIGYILCLFKYCDFVYV